MKRINKNKKNNLNRKAQNICRSIIALFAILGIVGGILALFDFNAVDWFKDKLDKEPKHVEVYLVPGDEWSSDGSSYGAWCWNDSGVPQGAFILATDENEDGVYELKISKEYTSMLFVDLVPDATELGADWKYKRVQTDNLKVPSDNNVYYHAYANQWSENADAMFVVTTAEVTVYLDTQAQWLGVQPPMIYCFDKTGKNEPQFVSMSQCGDFEFVAGVPAGYTHIIFLEYDETAVPGTWDGVLNQTQDLVIPLGSASTYDLEVNDWVEPAQE